uniref:Uncharacterized protein n=1 Tax=Strigamia maritima TaxID=126957 RepID=T1JNS3_STRMM
MCATIQKPKYNEYINKVHNPDIDYSENNSDTSIEEAPNDENERIPGDNDAFMNENEEENTIPSSEAVAQQQNDVQPIRIDELDEYERLSGCEVTLFTSNVDENVNPLELVEVCETEPKPRVNNLTQTLNPALDVSFALSEDYNANSNIQSAVNDCLERLGSPRSENAELKRNEGMEENQMNTNEEEEVVNDEDDWLERYDAACPIPRSGTVRKRSAESEVREIEANYDELLNSGLGLSRLWFTPSDCVVNGGQETENEVVGKVKRKKEKKQRNEEVIIAQINCDDSLEKQRKKKKKKRRCEDEIETENPVDVKKHKKHKKSRRGIEDEEVTCEKNETTNGMEENEKVKCKKRKNEDINGGDESTRKRKKRRSEIDENELNESSVTIVEEDTEQSVKVKRRKKTKKRQEETQINGDDDSINRDTKRRSREYDETLSSQDFRKSKKLTLNDSELKQEDTTEDDDGFLKSICSWQNKYGVDQIKQEVNDEQDDEIIDTQMELF